MGGNVGDKSKIFERARKLIGERIGLVTKMSSIYVTDSWGFESAKFWNQVIILSSSLNPFEILKAGQQIEKELGRIKKSVQYEDRTMDIDLLFYDNLQLNTPELIIPHAKIGDRRFVLIPLNEVASEKCHPVSGIKIKDLLANCTDQLKVNLLVI